MNYLPAYVCKTGLMPVCLVTAGSPVAGGCHQRVEMTTFGTFSQSKSMTKIRKLTPSGLGGSRLTTASSRGTTRAIPASLRSLVVAVFLVLASPPTLHGAFVNGIDVISQSYQISASWTEKSFVAPFFTSGGYSLSSSDGTPVAASTSTPDGLASAKASIGQFSYPGFDKFSLHNQYYASMAAFPDVIAAIGTSANGVWEFRAADAFLNLSLYRNYGVYSDFQNSGVVLTDMTTSTTLVDVSGFDTGAPNPFFSSYTFGVNTSDVYELSISAGSGATSDGRSSEDEIASMSSTPVPTNLPEGGLTIGMLGVGLSGLALIRRKLQG
ncbi:MAG TPA: hypothetical protein VN829_16870 [Dongiaceae bacterium]|nr:hypothetical protein [Dongiaceae bacterium]